MEAPLLRVMARVAEQRVADKLRRGMRIQSAVLADELVDEFSKFIQLAAHAESLRVKLQVHIEKIIARQAMDPTNA